jgi:hypothetical protein
LQHRGSHLVEVGVAFDEAAVRALLPEGLTPARGFTGGFALYKTDDQSAAAATPSGYIWFDVSYRGTARYIVRSFVAGEQTNEPLILAEATPDESDPDLLHHIVGSQAFRGLELVVKATPESCRAGMAEVSAQVFVLGRDGSLGVAQSPIIADWCEAEVHFVRMMAEPEEALDGLVPLRVLWAGVARPLGAPLPSLLLE